MAHQYVKRNSPLKVLEKVVIVLYLVIIIFFIYINAKNFNIGHGLFVVFLTIDFLFFLLGIKVYRSMRWIAAHIIEGYFVTFLYKIGLGKMAAKFINLMDDEDLQGDKDFNSFKQYMTRKKVFGRIIHRDWIDLSYDIGKDSVYIARHFIHQKKESLAIQDTAVTQKRLIDLSGVDFEKLIYRVFEAMGYTVKRTGKTTDQMCELFILLGEQKLLLQAIRYKNSSVGSTEIQEAVTAQKLTQCNGTMVISVSDFTTEAVELAKTNNVGLVGKQRLYELLAQYLKENWH